MEYKQFSQISHRKKLALLRKIAEKALLEYSVEYSNLRFYGEHSNALFKIQDRNGLHYILKIARPGDHSVEEIEGALKWLEYMNRQPGCPMMKVIGTNRGSHVVPVELDEIGEVRYCSLYSWEEGKNLSWNITLKNSREWGRLSGWIHEHADDYSRGAESRGGLMSWDKTFYWDEEVLFSKEHPESILPDKRRKIFRQTAEQVDQVIRDLFRDRSQIKLLHGDLHPDNVKIGPRGAAAIDVEDVMWCHPVQDISISLLYVRRKKNWPKIHDAFRDGYETQRTWPVQSDRQLWTLFCGRQMMFANYIIKLTDWTNAQKEEALGNYQESFEEYFKLYT